MYFNQVYFNSFRLKSNIIYSSIILFFGPVLPAYLTQGSKKSLPLRRDQNRLFLRQHNGKDEEEHFEFRINISRESRTTE